MIFVIPAATEAMKGIKPTAKTSCGETFVVRKRIRKGTTLAGMATSRQFKWCSCKARYYNNEYGLAIGWSGDPFADV